MKTVKYIFKRIWRLKNYKCEYIVAFVSMGEPFVPLDGKFNVVVA